MRDWKRAGFETFWRESNSRWKWKSMKEKLYWRWNRRREGSLSVLARQFSIPYSFPPLIFPLWYLSISLSSSLNVSTFGLSFSHSQTSSVQYIFMPRSFFFSLQLRKCMPYRKDGICVFATYFIRCLSLLFTRPSLNRLFMSIFLPSRLAFQSELESETEEGKMLTSAVLSSNNFSRILLEYSLSLSSYADGASLSLFSCISSTLLASEWVKSLDTFRRTESSLLSLSHVFSTFFPIRSTTESSQLAVPFFLLSFLFFSSMQHAHR